MRASFLFLIFAVLGIISCTNDKVLNQTNAVNELHQRLDSLGQSILDQGEILGYSVSIDSAGNNLYNGNFGYIDSDKKNIVNADTRFDIASISKLIGVCVIMKLYEQGKLGLDQSLEELLPEFHEPELARKINLRHLISTLYETK